eukprot:218850-Prymnesium_polylepis.1
MAHHRVGELSGHAPLGNRYVRRRYQGAAAHCIGSSPNQLTTQSANQLITAHRVGSSSNQLTTQSDNQLITAHRVGSRSNAARFSAAVTPERDSSLLAI